MYWLTCKVADPNIPVVPHAIETPCDVEQKENIAAEHPDNNLKRVYESEHEEDTRLTKRATRGSKKWRCVASCLSFFVKIIYKY